MASDDYISSYNTSNSKTVHVNGSGTITAKMVYGVYDRSTRSVVELFATPTLAEDAVRRKLTKRPDVANLCVLTIPA